MTTDLRDALHERLDHLTVPPGDLDRVRTSGTRLRRRRRAAAGAAVVGVVVIATLLGLGRDDDPGGSRGIDPIGQLDFSDGLRAYADPGRVIRLGDREFSADRLDFLDTDAVATPYGVVFYSVGRPMLLTESGEASELEPGAERAEGHPTSKVDSQRPWVAYAAAGDDGLEVVVRDLSSGDEVARRSLDPGAVIDGIDGGVVFLRTDAGTTTWDATTGEVQELAGPRTRVADVRNGVLLHDGPAPDGPAAAAYRLVEGAIDAQLTLDGSHVLSWSNRLEATDGGPPIVLDRKATFFAIDTDGSVLAATVGDPAEFYDCEVPSGRCTDLGSLRMTGGDPVFIGVDM